jgi:hypothetical protein
MTTPPAPPPGWYPDPAGGVGRRYWDGTAWSAVAPGMTASQPTHGTPPVGGIPAPAILAPKPGMSKGRKIALGVGGGILALAAIGSIGDSNKSSSSSSKTVTATKYAEAPTTATATNPPRTGPMTVIDEDGTFVVGQDIVPGTYRTDGGDRCYWERLSGLGGNFSDIISNSGAEGQQVVQILPTDAAFKTQRCGLWKKTG